MKAAFRPGINRAGRSGSQLASCRGKTLLLAGALLAWGALAGCERERVSTEQTQRPIELSQVPEFSLLDQAGKTFGSADLAGKVYLATFMFTRCPSVCPRVTTRMKEVDAAVQQAGLSLEFVSISVDPEYDTPVALAAYAKKHEVEPSRFHFLTGDYQQIAKTAEDGFKIGVSGQAEEGKPHFGISHGSHLVLVNRQGQIVGYFPSSEPESVARIVDAIRPL